MERDMMFGRHDMFSERSVSCSECKPELREPTTEDSMQILSEEILTTLPVKSKQNTDFLSGNALRKTEVAG